VNAQASSFFDPAMRRMRLYAVVRPRRDVADRHDAGSGVILRRLFGRYDF